MATRRDRRWRYLTMEEVRDYARQADPLGVWGGRGLEHPRVETSRRLCGLSLTLELKEAGERLYAFADEHHLHWRDADGREGEALYNACSVPGCPELLVVHHYKAGFELPRCTDLILDLETGYVTVVDAEAGHPDNPREVMHRILFGRIGGIDVPPEAAPPAFTKDLVGRAVQWFDPGSGRLPVKYVYLTEGYYTYSGAYANGEYWQATNPADQVRLRKDVYLSSAVEARQSGFQLNVIMNLALMRDCMTGFGIGGAQGEPNRLELWMHSGREGSLTELYSFY